MLRGPTLPWNREKTWAGTSCFLLVGAPLASLIYWGETTFNPESLGAAVPFGAALICGSSATFVAAIAESYRSRIDDNIRVGFAAAVTVVIAHGSVIGWA
jgi:dolichol kinase